MNSDWVVKKSLIIKAPAMEVWSALTDPGLIKQWLYGTNVISDWKTGSAILFTGVWQGKEYKDKGAILQLEPGKIFQYNYWSGFSGLADVPENYSIITFELSPRNEETTLTLTQSKFATETMYEHSDKNWESTLELMRKLIEKK